MLVALPARASRSRCRVPEQPLNEANPPGAANAKLSHRLDFDQLDAVPQATSDRILWQAVFGRHAKPPPPGPNASPEEHAKAEAKEEAGR